MRKHENKWRSLRGEKHMAYMYQTLSGNLLLEQICTNKIGKVTILTQNVFLKDKICTLN